MEKSADFAGFSREKSQNSQKNRLISQDFSRKKSNFEGFSGLILLHEKFLQFDWLRAVVFQLNLKYLHVKITNLLRVVL